MSLAYFIVVNHDAPGFDTFVNGKAVAKQSETLDALARQLEVKPLEDFLSVSEAIAEEFDSADAPREKWFTPEEGLQTVSALITYLEQHPNGVKNSKAVLEELREYQNVLTNIQKVNLQWRFEIDF
jgi:hypothetical protein